MDDAITPYAFTQDVPIPWPIYEQIREELGLEPPAGLIAHLVLQTETGLRYVDVWESKQHCEAFMDARVHPALDRVFARAGRSRAATGEPCQSPIVVREVWAPRQLLRGRTVTAR
jgi:hypothetical protein